MRQTSYGYLRNGVYGTVIVRCMPVCCNLEGGNEAGPGLGPGPAELQCVTRGEETYDSQSREMTPTTSISTRNSGFAKPTSMKVLAGGSSTSRGAYFW